MVGGYAVGHHGYVRATVGSDVWIRPSRENAERVAAALRDFGFDLPQVTPDLFLQPERVVRMGQPPIQLEIQTSLTGVGFEDCWQDRQAVEWEGVPTQVISLDKLKINKKAAGRAKDLSDLDYLP